MKLSRCSDFNYISKCSNFNYISKCSDFNYISKCSDINYGCNRVHESLCSDATCVNSGVSGAESQAIFSTSESGTRLDLWKPIYCSGRVHS